MTAPTFSVLVASYNQGHYLTETLDTVAWQTWTDYELIVVDDGSTDDTAAVLERWVDDFRREHPNPVTVCRLPTNSGQSAAFEHGFAHCRGAYVCLLDSDDRWLPEKLSRVARAASAAPEVGMIVHPLHVIGPDGRRTGDVRPRRARLSDGDVRRQVATTGRQIAPASSGVVIATDLFRALIPMPTRGFPSGADAYLTLAASLRAPVRAIPQPLGEYRMHSGSAYLRRMLSPEGVQRSVDLQLAIARHCGLEAVVGRNSYFARNVFARAKFAGTRGERIAAYRDLVRATLGDAAFAARERALLAAFWTLCLLAPRSAFLRLWRAFQLKQTGHDRL